MKRPVLPFALAAPSGVFETIAFTGSFASLAPGIIATGGSGIDWPFALIALPGPVILASAFLMLRNGSNVNLWGEVIFAMGLVTLFFFTLLSTYLAVVGIPAIVGGAIAVDWKPEKAA